MTIPVLNQPIFSKKYFLAPPGSGTLHALAQLTHDWAMKIKPVAAQPIDDMADLRERFHIAIRSLSPNRQAYVNAYLLIGTVSGASREVYSSARGGEQANNDPVVQEAILIGQQYRLSIMHADAQRVMVELIDMIDADPAGMLGADGLPLPLDQWPKALRKRLKAFRPVIREGKTFAESPKFTESRALVELLGKHVGVNAWKQEDDGGRADEFAARLQAAENALSARLVEPDATHHPAVDYLPIDDDASD